MGKRFIRHVACVALVAGFVPHAGLAQERIPAKPGETCTNFNAGCEDWCRKNMNASQAQGCLDVCKEQLASCKTTGQWSTESGTKIVAGLPPQ